MPDAQVDQAAAEAAAAKAAADAAAAAASSGDGAPAKTDAELQAEREAQVAAEAARVAEEDARVAEEAKKTGGLSKRFSELTRQAKEAKQREAEAQRRLDLALDAVEQLKSTRPPPAGEKPAEEEPEPEMPVFENFEKPAEFTKAVLEYTKKMTAREATIAVKAAEAKRTEEAAKSNQQAATARIQQDFSTRVNAFKAEHPDYDEVAGSEDVSISTTMAVGIARSAQGPAIAYYLGQHKTEAERIAKLDPAEQLMELGAIVKTLSTPAASRTTGAPPPLRPLSGGSTPPAKSPDEMSMDEYAAHRRQAAKGAVH